MLRPQRSRRRWSCSNAVKSWWSTPKSPALKSVEELLPDIIALLRMKTVHDFTLYKHGTLERRVERRMALAAVKSAAEGFPFLGLGTRRNAMKLSRDLLINVTGFFACRGFRFSRQERYSRPCPRPPAQPTAAKFRVAGWSSGEIRSCDAGEQIEASKRDVKLQIFATDVDPDAVGVLAKALSEFHRGRYRQNDWSAFFPRRITTTGSRLNYARTSCSRCMTCSPIRHSRV